MRLSSTEISNSKKAESDCSLEDCDAVDEKMGSLTCGFEPLLDEIVEKMPEKTEYIICVDKPTDELEVAMCKLEGTTITDDKRVFVSSERVECVTVAVKEESHSVNVKSIQLDQSLKEEIKSSPQVHTSPHIEVMEYKDCSENIKPRSIVEDDISIKNVCNNEVTKVPPVKRGRKRKYLGSSECNGDVKGKNVKVEKCGAVVTGRVLRSRPMTNSGSVKVDESGLNESYVCFKRKMEDECLSLNQTELKEINEKSQLTGQPQKKKKRRGRPPKAQGESKSTHLLMNDDVAVPKKVERRGRPPKVKGHLKKSNVLVDKKVDKQLKDKDVKKGDNKIIQNVEIQNSNVLEDKKVDKQERGKDVQKGDNKIIQNVEKQEGGGLERREVQKLVRDKIVNMVLKAGWKIEYRPRNGREYLDAVYVDLKGRTYWSVTKAYYSLQKGIKSGKAEIQEVSAFTPVPEEEMSVLFRVVSKVRCDKEKPRKKNKKGINKAEIVISNESEVPVKKKLKKKKVKDGKKKKEVKLGNKSVKTQPKVSQKSQPSRKPRLVARSSSKGNDEENDGCLIYNGKRNLLTWMIDSGVVMPGGKVQYKESKKTRNRLLLEGKVTHDGIHCSCCNQTMNITDFVSHSGGTLKNIYFQSSSVLTCLLESWKKEEVRFNLVDVEGGDPNDDTCNICGDGGDLICCDGCPSTFHHSCLDIENFPSGVWHCVYCCCKFCGLGSHYASEMISCCLCEEKFHRLCVQEDDAPNLDSSGQSFCGRKCQELFEKIKTYVGVKYELEDGFSWTLLQRADVSNDSAPEKIECNSKLAVAFAVMDECFVPIMDERSGVNMIHDVVYNCGSNFRRLNYSGFFTAILERGDEMVAAASIRIHGNRLAEMPFIGTRHMYRRQGMCRRLLDAIESALGSLGVGELVIPAIPELYKTWTTVFGFKPLKKSKRQTMKSMRMIVFPGTDILQKPLLNNQFADQNHSPAGDDKGVGCLSVTNDDNALHSETKPLDPIDDVAKEATAILKDDQRSESETLAASFEGPLSSDTKSENVSIDSDVPSFDDGTSEHDKVGVVVKNTFDLNLQPDSDIQSNDQDPFELLKSRADNDGVLV